MSNSPTIVGAGLAGLVAAHAWPQAPVFEASAAPRAGHKALLRFRTDAVSHLVGIEFRKVRVHKGIWADGAFQAPSILWANNYAQKVLQGRLRGDRSIWEIDPVERFIAPDNLYEQLIDAVGNRVRWDSPVDFADSKSPIISTAPLTVVLKALNIAAPVEFPRASIRVVRWKISNCDVFQTTYFPEPWLNVYRASITGDKLIVESVGELTEDDTYEVGRAFGIRLEENQFLESIDQKYGKIASIDDAVRKQLLFTLTHNHNIYSLGRFATWRNILLDDVVNDVVAIKRLLKTNSAYDARKAAT